MQTYKDEPGTWVGVTRRNLSEAADAQFEVRYFEIAPDGYTSFEKHEHEHCVIVLRGIGEVRLGDNWTQVTEQDVVRVSGGEPHQFRNRNREPFGILCIVNRERDRPVLLEDGSKDSIAVSESSTHTSKG
ncbi:MAG: cupin domain-containing protein [Fimbriimonadaceae bacterium]|nr:cupin domain-containing protein [Fimbriimonadaceae bacterium]